MAAVTHDLVILGAGPGGYVAAIRAGQLGMNVACVDEVPALGGTCVRIGCIPSKALLESSERFHEAGHALAAHGVKVAGVELDLPTMMKRKDQIVGDLTRGVEFLFKKNKVTRYLGHARIAGPGRVTVTGADGAAVAEPVEISAKHIVIATGSKPAPLKGV
ncbi:MAG TPA: FAD-dependent oxidoreductase, partial [Candidatus Eisenbacteria bacterium]|nr:FAD-dependent oxidoreductase [Candidatus Eisenbacteria bacterium]